MAHVPIFHGVVSEDGERLLFASEERSARRGYLKSLAGERVEWTVRKERTQRSLDQNSYLHAVPVAILAEEWGEDVETTKLLILGECFGWRDAKDGHRLPMKPSTSALTVEEFSKLIEWLPVWAMFNFRVHIPLPNEVEAA